MNQVIVEHRYTIASLNIWSNSNCWCPKSSRLLMETELLSPCYNSFLLVKFFCCLFFIVLLRHYYPGQQILQLVLAATDCCCWSRSMPVLVLLARRSFLCFISSIKFSWAADNFSRACCETWITPDGIDSGERSPGCRESAGRAERCRPPLVTS